MFVKTPDDSIVNLVNCDEIKLELKESQYQISAYFGEREIILFRFFKDNHQAQRAYHELWLELSSGNNALDMMSLFK